jgi:predicted ATP-dependent endonuclease of OLD family
VTLVEEPEAHLHPQACLEIAELLGGVTGQLVASTHSAHLVTSVEPRAIRLLRTDAKATTVVDLGPGKDEGRHVPRALRPSMHASEMEKLKRQVERPFGELLFASAIVIGDGATERAFLPIALRHALGGTRSHGVCVIDPGSMSTPLAIAAVKFANLVGIPWLLFADDDDEGRKAAADLVKEQGAGDTDVIVAVSVRGTAARAGSATEKMMLAFDDSLCRDACFEMRPDLDGSKETLLLLRDLKGVVGSSLGRLLIERHPDRTCWPSALCELVDKLDKRLTK